VSLISKVMDTLRFLGGHGVEIERSTWEREYERGTWAYLHGLDQYPRYCVLAGYVRCLGAQRRILDVGCGDGALEHVLAQDGFARYVGLDLSEQALSTARAAAGSGATYVQGDAATWQPDGTFDVIVFNEVLYYFYEPLAVMRHYEAALAPGGVFVVSMYRRGGTTRRLWSMLVGGYPCLHETRLQSGSRGSWVVGVLGRPGATVETVLKPPA